MALLCPLHATAVSLTHPNTCHARGCIDRYCERSLSAAPITDILTVHFVVRQPRNYSSPRLGQHCRKHRWWCSVIQVNWLSHQLKLSVPQCHHSNQFSDVSTRTGKDCLSLTNFSTALGLLVITINYRPGNLSLLTFACHVQVGSMFEPYPGGKSRANNLALVTVMVDAVLYVARPAGCDCNSCLVRI